MAALAGGWNEEPNPLKQSIFHRLSSVLWGAIVIAVVLLAIYVSVGRMLSSLTGAYQQEILRELNYRVPFHVDADQVSAEWHSFTPVLVLEGLQLTLPGEAEDAIELSEGRIALDVAASLLTRAPQLTQLRLRGLNLAGELDADGRLHISGFEGGDTRLDEWLADFLANVERVEVGEAHLDLVLADGERRDVDLDLALSREGSRRRLEGTLSGSRGLEIMALAEGVGNPFEPGSFTGELYLDIAADQVGAVTDLLGDTLGQVQIEGHLDMELWSSWDRGEPGAVLRLAMNDVLLQAADSGRQLPLDRLALEAQLQSRQGGWLLTLAGLELARDEVLLALPRLQLDLRGETVELRVQDVALEPLGQLLAGTGALPPSGDELIGLLHPRGTLSRLQVNVSDISAPMAGWQLAANFTSVAVDAWHGAPALSGASGYTQLAPGGGSVVLDSKQFSMHFPTVYEQPLAYDDFHGTINLAWDEQGVTLSSGLVQAHGDEGPVRVLFGLAIPRVASEVGLEMDLLVGLQDTPAYQREKYIPYILSEQLRPWLAASIEDGLIEQGGFLWRGSLTHDSPGRHTVQLFFNVRDAALDYHPEWPPLDSLNATVLINDTDVSVWADTARLFDTRVSELSVEVWMDDAAQLWLAVDGDLAGPAADGLAVINSSPLRQSVGDVFAEWRLTGEMETDLALLLNLTDSSIGPDVDLSAHLHAVDLDIRPGNLPLRGISGIIDYDTAVGFSSRDLVGQLWEQPMEVAVTQLPAQSGSAVVGSPVSVAVAGTVDMRDIHQWLGLDMLAFASGQAGVTLELLAAAGVPPTVTIDSTLAGVSLDLPTLWGKPAGTEQPLHLTLAPGEDQLLLALDLAGGLTAELELVDGKLRSGVLALGSEAAQRQTGRLQIGGHLAAADASQWQQFLATYFAGDNSMSAPGEEQEGQLQIAIDSLQVDELLVGGHNLGAVSLSATDDGGHWRVKANSDWLRGELLYFPAGQSQLHIGYLDLAGLDRLEPAVGDEADVIEVPPLQVTIDELRKSDMLLGNLAFALQSEGPDLTASEISGRIAGLQLRPDNPGELHWHQGPDSLTTLMASLYFEDLGQTLEQLGYQKAIVTENGSFELALAWPGGPQDFALQVAQGSLLVDIGEGHFPEVSVAAAGTLRVVSILNLAEIVQRLSLSQMFESGIPFNKVDGEVRLHAGTIEVASMDVEGSASSFQFSGVSTVASRALDGELVVTLPVANNLPWVAALTAGLPVAAGVFLLSKVFENQFNRLTSLVYTVSGTWDDPEVTFDRVFDDTAAPGAGAAPAAATPAPPVPRVPATGQPGSP